MSEPRRSDVAVRSAAERAQAMRIALGSVLAILAIAAPLASAGPDKGRPAQISWADKQHRYGWAFSPGTTKGGWCPSHYATPRICATEDGGNHWRGILYGKIDAAPFVLRSTSYAGLVVVQARKFRFSLGTLDNGRHWYRVSQLSGVPTRVRGGHVFWDSGAYSFRLGGWPPPRNKKANCRVGRYGIRWVPGIFSQGSRPNICWEPHVQLGGGPVGAILGLSIVVVKAPDQSISSWADARHGFATDPAGVKWRCTPKAARREQGFGPSPTVLCRTEDGGKHWEEIFVLEDGAKRFDTVEWIGQIWRGPADDGVMVLSASGDGANFDRTFVSHDAGASWTYEDAFYAGYDNVCDLYSTAGTVCASGPVFHQAHGDPLELVYDLNVCTSTGAYDFDSCETQTYRMDGWPKGPLEPVKLSP
jgi:hypothetical protein